MAENLIRLLSTQNIQNPPAVFIAHNQQGTEDEKLVIGLRIANCLHEIMKTDIKSNMNQEIIEKRKEKREEFDELVCFNLLIEAGQEVLTPRSFKIFSMRFNLDGNTEKTKTLQTIGNEFQLSRERIRQIVLKSIIKIRKKSNDANYRSCLEFYQLISELLSNTNNNPEPYQLLKDFHRKYFSFMDFQLYIWFLDNFLNKKIIFDDIRQIMINEKISLRKLCWSEKVRLRSDEKMKRILIKIQWPKETRPYDDNLRQYLYPKRRVKDRGEFSGSFFSKKMDSNIEYESTIELSFIKLCELSDEIKSYYPQPLKISYNDSRLYYPDILIVFNDNRMAMIELKDKLNMITSFTRTKYLALKKFCNEKGIGFLMTDCYTSFEELMDHIVRNDFEAEVLSRSFFNWPMYKVVREKYSASFKDLATVVLNNDLEFNLQPFGIKHKLK